jgi:hypothetical protein
MTFFVSILTLQDLGWQQTILKEVLVFYFSVFRGNWTQNNLSITLLEGQPIPEGNE